MRLTGKLCTVAAALIFAAPTAMASDVFLCMRPDSNIAITADINGDYQYTSMIDSNGVKVYPILAEGNTYLPLRYICEITGLDDGGEISGEIPDGYFRYNQIGKDGVADIEIRYNNQYYRQNIGEKFTYTAADGTSRDVAIYNIDGTLYVPMAYITKITDSYALWNGDDSQVMFLGNNLEKADYLESNNHLIRSKEMRLGFDLYGNNAAKSPLYLKSDGETIADLSQELDNAPDISSVSRRNDVIYYVDENNVIKTKTENLNDSKPLVFRDGAGGRVEILASTAMVIQNKLFGISISTPKAEDGRLFVSNLDGSDFRYITDKNIYGLVSKRIGSFYYLFFCESDNRSVPHMIEVETMDDYTIEITNHDRENMLADIKQLFVGKACFYYIDNNGRIHVIKTPHTFEFISIYRLDDNEHKIFITGDDGGSIENVDYMNFDHINNVLYAVKDGKIYYHTPEIGRFKLLCKLDSGMDMFSLFGNIAYQDMFAVRLNGNIQTHRLKYSGDTIELY